MQVHDIMSANVHLANPNTTIRDAARQMRAENIGALPVGENDRLIGMVTDMVRHARSGQVPARSGPRPRRLFAPAH